jgi:hypothetical protein
MTAHGDVVTWCVGHTAARPAVVAKAMVCVDCCVAGSCTLSHMCEVEGHAPEDGWDTAAVLAACWAGDAALLRRLMREHAECDAGVRRRTLVDAVSCVLCAPCYAVRLWSKGLRVRRCCRQNRGGTALLWACTTGRLDVARWLVADAGSDARSERDNVSGRCSCRRLCVFLSCRVRPRCVPASCDRVACRRRALRRSIAQPFCWHVRTATSILRGGS